MMDTETPTIINSLTSNGSKGSRQNNTTSLAEALATKVADYMCEGGSENTRNTLRKNGDKRNNPLNSPSSSMAPLNSDLPSENLKGRGRHMPPPPPRETSSTTVMSENKMSKNNYDGSLATSIISTSSNNSSMGSNILDLASSCNFRQQTPSSSKAPIISGTAAEVLALQNALRDYSTTNHQNGSGAIVSNPSSVESTIASPTNVSSNPSLTRNTSDGAPMISGTAAAQMAMIATAAKITENGAVNNRKRDGTGHQQSFHNVNHLDVDAVASLKVGQDNLRQISPEDLTPSGLASTTVIGNSSTSGTFGNDDLRHCRPLHIESNNRKGGAGGMDILAEITCHAPPMPLYHQPPTSSAASASSYQQSSFNYVKHRVSGIPSYQEIYREMGQQQQQTPTSSFNQRHGYIGNDTISVNTTQQTHSTATRFGHPYRSEILEEGKELFTRKDLITYGGHLFDNKDVHGHMKDGCDSIVIANLEKDIREGDGLIWFLFSTDRTNGGGALFKSFCRKLPVRVFRSSTLSGRYAPPYLDDEENEEDDEIAYRYDGLYTIDAVWDVHGQETETCPCLGADGWQTYFFTRVPKRPLEKEKHVAGMKYNKLGMQELWCEIQKMRGVRRPKKFEIPMAPIKLPPMKRVAITGRNASRKIGAYQPPSLEELQKKQREEIKQHAKLLKRQQQSSLSSKNGSGRFKRSHDGSQSSEEEDGDDTVGNERGEMDSKSKHRIHSPISHQSSSSDKVVTPRPRLNSSVSPGNKDSTKYDSSDSENSTSGERSPAKLPSPKASTTAMDSSMFFPKRASAARAENANREMFGKKKRPYNRRSQTKESNKRKKIDESDSDGDDSSNEDNLVDQAVLTVGSRVLVQYKGSLFKATIRKRREKNEKYSFLIHYDGNKKTNVHWVPLEHITEILSICLDASPQSESTNKGGAVKRRVKKAKRSDVPKRSAAQRQKQDLNQGNNDDADEVMTEEPSLPHQLGVGVKEDMKENDNDDKTKSLPQCEESTVENRALVENEEMVVDDPLPAGVEKASSDMQSAEIPTTKASKSHDLKVERPSLPADQVFKNEEESEPSSPDANLKTESKPMDIFKHPVGGHVYVEYGRSRVFYHSTIVDRRKKRTACEYLVHYDGYKKSANRWVRESALHEVNSDTTRRFEEQRNVPGEVLSTDASAERSTRGRKRNDKDNLHQKESKPARKMRSDVSELSSESVLGNIEPGVAFLQGSVVFAEWNGVLFLAKMVKKRYSGERTEYLVSYDGYSNKYDAWVSIRKIYEVNPQTKRAFKQLKAGKDPPGGMRQETRKREENENDEDDNTVESAPKKRVYRKRSSEEISSTASLTRRGSRKRKDDSSEASVRSSTRASKTSTLDMQGIESGVEFLPGSTIFAEYKGGLCLAKMIKKRGKGDYMEYYIQYMGLKKTEEAWMSVGLLYEINPQTKRMFRVYSKTS